jgi:predicted house-cleaning noncanonical NTP pyrophosphatase (MazG superfamily)
MSYNEQLDLKKEESTTKIFAELPPKPPKAPGKRVITIPGKLLPPTPRRLVCERLPELPKKPHDIYIERWLPMKDMKRKIILNPKPDDPISCNCEIKNLIVDWDRKESKIKNVITNLGIEKTDPIEYVDRYGETLITPDNLPEIVNELRKEQNNEIVLASDQNFNYYMELEGDIDAFEFIDDFKKEELGDLKAYLKDIISEEKLKKKSKQQITLTETKENDDFQNKFPMVDKIFKFTESDILGNKQQ